MFAQLGNIKFELITYFNGLNETVSYNYAQHERIENKPILQFLGKNLQEENINLNFHRTFCVPENELKALVEVADKAEPLKFIKGNGEYVGVFVIEEIGKTTEQASAEAICFLYKLNSDLENIQEKIDEKDETEKGFKKKA